MILVCDVISQDHVIIWSCDFMGKSDSMSILFLSSFVAIGTVVVEIQ